MVNWLWHTYARPRPPRQQLSPLFWRTECGCVDVACALPLPSRFMMNCILPSSSYTDSYAHTDRRRPFRKESCTKSEHTEQFLSCLDMADPLSIAAAGAGFLSLAGQVADGLIKLRAFYKASKYAPQGVQYWRSTMTPFGTLCVEALGCNCSLPGTQNTKQVYARARLKAWITGLHPSAVDLLQYATQESLVLGCNPNLLTMP